jgi:hypothetical protein
MTPDEVAWVQKLTLAQAKSYWCGLIAEGLPLIDARPPNGAAAPPPAAAPLEAGWPAPRSAAAAALARVGARMNNFLGLLSIWNWDVYTRFLTSRADGSDDAVFGDADAPLAHWCVGRRRGPRAAGRAGRCSRPAGAL